MWALVVALPLAAILFAKLAPARESADPMPEVDSGLFEKATFAGGCFWCMEGPFDKIDGVVSTTSGYAGGTERNPTYEQVAAGKTGHAEVVQVVFDPAKVRFDELLRVYWRNIDPVGVDRQFCDRGRQYRSAIFTHSETQRDAALKSREALEASQRFEGTIATEIEAVGEFYPAEAYHQDFYERNPLRYRFYRRGCGRDARLRALWGEEAGG